MCNIDTLTFRSFVCDLVSSLTTYRYKDGKLVRSFSQSELAVELGLTQSSLSRVANGVSTINSLAFYRLLVLCGYLYE